MPSLLFCTFHSHTFLRATINTQTNFDSLRPPYLAYAHNVCIRALQCATPDAVATQTEYPVWVATARVCCWAALVDSLKIKMATRSAALSMFKIINPVWGGRLGNTTKVRKEALYQASCLLTAYVTPDLGLYSVSFPSTRSCGF